MFYDSKYYLLTFLRKNMHTHIFIREDQISRLEKDMPTLGYIPPGGKISSPGVRYPGGHVQGKITCHTGIASLDGCCGGESG